MTAETTRDALQDRLVEAAWEGGWSRHTVTSLWPTIEAALTAEHRATCCRIAQIFVGCEDEEDVLRQVRILVDVTKAWRAAGSAVSP